MTYKFQDKTLSIEERIDDLLGRMTLGEKVRQMDIYAGTEFQDQNGNFQMDKLLEVSGEEGLGCLQNRYSSAEANNEIQRRVMERSRLPIPVLFSEEALHGLIWPGCTVFPQQLALAATFEPSLAKEQGHAIASECRSLGIHETWSPVLDLARDPRWGRVEEGYGEDTYLASRFAENMVKGLQGDDLTRPDTMVAEVKHFSGYGAPTGGLNCAPAMMGRHEHEFYCLPVFEAAFKAGALNAMCSYNSIDGVPVACDRSILTDQLRGKLGMRGFVRADMTAVAMLHTCHFVARTPKEAMKMGVQAGVDMQLYDFPHDVYQTGLLELVRDGELDEALIDQSVRRILRVKFMLGLFENPFTDESLSKKVVHCEEHVDTARKVAEKAICLLKNQNGLLPLKKDIGTIAVIGPSAAVPRFGDYSAPGECKAAVSVLDGIKGMVSDQTKVLYARGCHILESQMMPVPTAWLRTPQGEPGLQGEYFNGQDFSGEPVVTRIDPSIHFNWIYTQPGDGIDAGCFGVRWTGSVVPSEDFNGFIGLSSMDSMRLWIDGELIVDRWQNSEAESSREVHWKAGERHDVKVEFINDQRGVRVILGYSYGENDMEEAVRAAKQADVAVVVVGDDETTCGENLDRADLDLPGRQKELVRRISETGAPVVLVLQTGRPVSIVWESEHIPAILEAWTIGEQGGTAIAETLFGDCNPGGRLPMSFPKSVGQLPVHYNRRPFGAVKYVEMDWNPLYPFGYGLSYTKFQYSNFRLSKEIIAKDGEVEVSLDVTNVGDVYGEDVPQFYIHDEYSSVVRPYKELAGFERVGLNPGETKTVTVAIGPRQLRLLNRDFQWEVEPGKFTIMAGSHSCDLPFAAILTVTE